MEPGFALLLVGIIVVGGIVLFVLSNVNRSRGSGSDSTPVGGAGVVGGSDHSHGPGHGHDHGGDGGGHGGHGGSDGGGGGGGGDGGGGGSN